MFLRSFLMRLYAASAHGPHVAPMLLLCESGNTNAITPSMRIVLYEVFPSHNSYAASHNSSLMRSMPIVSPLLSILRRKPLYPLYFSIRCPRLCFVFSFSAIVYVD